MLLFKEQLRVLWQDNKPPSEINNTKYEEVEIKPSTFSWRTGALVYISLSLIGMTVSSAIATYVFFGSITLAGLIALSESNRRLKRIITRGNKLLDMIIFGFTIFATISLGITLTASLTFAGLGYTLVYAPYLRSR